MLFTQVKKSMFIVFLIFANSKATALNLSHTELWDSISQHNPDYTYQSSEPLDVSPDKIIQLMALKANFQQLGVLSGWENFDESQKNVIHYDLLRSHSAIMYKSIIYSEKSVACTSAIGLTDKEKPASLNFMFFDSQGNFRLLNKVNKHKTPALPQLLSRDPFYLTQKKPTKSGYLDIFVNYRPDVIYQYLMIYCDSTSGATDLNRSSNLSETASQFLDDLGFESLYLNRRQD